MRIKLLRFKSLLLLSLLWGCQATEPAGQLAIEKLRAPKPDLPQTDSQVVDAEGESDRTKIIAGVPSGFKPRVSSVGEIKNVPELPEGMFSGSYNNMGVAAFINEVFGNQLNLSFSIQPEVQALEELVTLRLLEPVDATQFFRVAQETLRSYGVSLTDQEQLISFGLNAVGSAREVPLVISGVALPDVPETHRPLFVFRPINVVEANMLQSWLRKALRGLKVQIEVVPQTNAILVQGKRSEVEQVMSMVSVLDQATLRGSYSYLIEPVYSDAEGLAKDLIEVLKSQGYNASSRPPAGSIMILPMESSNKLVIVAASQAVLSHAINWAEILDRSTTSGIEDGVFSYRVRNTDVEHIVSLMSALASAKSSKKRRKKNKDDNDAGISGARFIADTNRNALVFGGSGRDWVELLPAIKAMDVPTPSVLVEVILAEVTLNDQDESGIEFLARSGEVTFSTLSALGLSGNGLTATFNRAGETRAVLNAFYQSDKANIRSRPRLMVKSGQAASIDVGNEIPYVKSTSQSVQDAGSPIIQNVAYRKTGIVLQVEPVVHSSGFVDIRISQELSEAAQTSTSSIDSPTIFNRKIETTVTLRDGGSVLLGGLISESSADSNKGIKGLGRVNSSVMTHHRSIERS